jgi:predicted HTH domain antitoxin
MKGVLTVMSETTKEAVKLENIKKNRVKLAVNLYKKGKVSIGMAAEISGRDIKSFMDLLITMGVKIPLSL